MKTFRILGMALVAVMLGFAMSACSDDDDEYLKELEKEYSQLIVGKWFDFTPTSSMLHVYHADGTFNQIGYSPSKAWRARTGNYHIEGNKLIREFSDGNDNSSNSYVIEVTSDKFTIKAIDETGDKVHHRVKESFDITGIYTFLNSAVGVVPAVGKTEMKLPEGITFGGKTSISVEALNGERIVEQMKAYFTDAMFTPNAKLRHTVDGTVMYKDYALDGNNLSFELNKGHELNATSFPDEDGDRLFIIIPKQEAWVGGLADVIRKENPANVLTDAAIAALEKEFMDTFETFTVVLSLSKTGEYNAAVDVDPYKDYPQLIVGKWFNFSQESSVFLEFRTDKIFSQVGYDKEKGWGDYAGTYQLNGDMLIRNTPNNEIGDRKIEIKDDKLFIKIGDSMGDRVNYRVKESFNITGKYAYLNSVVRVTPKEGKSELKLPEGITFGGKTSISIEAMNGERIVEQMKAYFADAMFTPNAKLRHTVDGTVMYKDYALDGNNLSFELNKGHELNATSFPDEDGDRLFIIIPKQEAWVGGLANAIRMENPANVMTDEVVAALEKEFMDTFETFTVVLSLSKTGEYNAAEDVDPYKDYPQLIVGKWFNFTPTASVFMNFGTDGKYIQQGYDIDLGWIEYHGNYRIDGNVMNKTIENNDGTYRDSAPATIEVTNDKFIVKIDDPNLGDKENYRVQESFDIKGNYSYLNALAKVEPVSGKTALQLPEGITFQGKNAIPVEMLHGERIIEAAKSFFADATFAADGKLEHQMGEETKHKNYTLDGNSLVFNLYEGSDVYKVNANAFPDEDGDRLFIIMPKQAAWMGGFVELIEKENTGLKMTEAQIKELETEFLTTFDTFTVILSLSKK